MKQKQCCDTSRVMSLSITPLCSFTPSRKSSTVCIICSPLCLLAAPFCLPMTMLQSLCVSTSFFYFYLSLLFFWSLLCLTDMQAPTVHITQPHGVSVKAAQGPLKLGRFPAGFLEECICVRSETCFLFFCAASQRTCNISGQTTACKMEKKGERN